MSVIVRYNFSTLDESSLYSLDYEIFKNDFTDRWLQALQYELNRKVPMQQDGFYGSCNFTEEQLRLEMQKCIDIINSSSDGPWLKSSVYSNMEHKHLMEIHEEFENLDRNPEFNSSKTPRQSKEALYYLNKLIHKYERVNTGGVHNFHIDALFKNPQGWTLKEEDYKFFSMDCKKGVMYLDYGVTGVPVLTAFYNNVKQRPVPQYDFKAGVKLIFFESIHDDRFRSELKSWLAEKWQMDIEDPKLAIGHIPLGRLVGKSDIDKIFGELEKHLIIKPPEILDGVTLQPVCIPYISSQMQTYSEYIEKKAKKNLVEEIINPSAIWPNDIEIQNYLNFQPWIKLPWHFHPISCYEEVMALQDRFVAHRNHDVHENSRNGWRSLAIKAQNGIATNTYAHTHYDEEENYQLTDVVEKCPKTMKMLNSITDIKQCRRIRWMILMPGAKISPHSDKQKEDEDVCWALNIALNMPDGCNFWIDTKK
ncbi:MAG: aspartyl/asparaginyl beta-hydroxylase domain-containing protein, partial [Halobacteriovoraceae bacterium]|nr:aspartyl/asparaginyl beta-hydroxylase domain-containing protein [Halobacteriovoraceae bacterium]